MLKFAALLSLASLIPAFVEAASPIYGQCGGQGWCKYLAIFLADMY